VLPSFDHCYRAIASRDARFDGWIYVGVTSTGIYCRPSCPATTPKRQNVRFYATAATAQGAGFRACRRCRPDAVPGSPEWDLRADVVARAMRLIADGVVDRKGVAGLAARLGYTARHLHRLLVAEVGAGPRALARAQRAHTARLLLETTDLPVTDVAFAAGFGSVRQFNDTVRAVFGCPPTGLRGRRSRGSRTPSTVVLRLPYRTPFDAESLLGHLADRAVPGLEQVTDSVYRRAVRLPHGTGVVELTPETGYVRCALRLADLRDLGVAATRCRRLLHLDADPIGAAQVLSADPLIRPLVHERPGLRVAGSVDAFETAIRAVLGQQVSIAAARTVAGRLVAAYGEPLAAPVDGLTHAFPGPEALAAAGELPMPASRARTIRSLAAAVADGQVPLSPGADFADVRAALQAVPGIGPWTVEYVALRGLGDPDAFPVGDLGLRRALAALGLPPGQPAEQAVAERWRPLRSLAAQHLWTHIVVMERSAA
jgi:AraC family transcriptional regulator of adaptative response / DNA-3-methyladenine glycosylase II